MMHIAKSEWPLSMYSPRVGLLKIPSNSKSHIDKRWHDVEHEAQMCRRNTIASLAR